MKRLMVFLCIAFLACSSAAVAATYGENWNADPGPEFGGWTNNYLPDGLPDADKMFWMPDGGVGDSGHLVLRRTDKYPSYVCPTLDPAKSAVTGNVNSKFGPIVTVSLDVWMENKTHPIDGIGFGWNFCNSADGYWYKNFYLPNEAPFFYPRTFLPGDANNDMFVDSDDAAVLAGNWLQIGGATWANGDFNADGNVDDVDATLMALNWLAHPEYDPARFYHVSATIDTTWTDAEANAAGWFHWTGTPEVAWATLMTDLKMWNFAARAYNYAVKTCGPYTTHVDNFQMYSGLPPEATSVPEPSLLILFTAGVLALGLLRRRSV